MKERLTIKGGIRLEGCTHASGAKNAILPIMAACLMMKGDTVLKNIPHLSDVVIMLKMLNALGVRAEYRHNNEIHISNTKKIRHIAPYDLVTSMRASFFVAGPILAKEGFAKVPLPGGCSIGARPVDLHLKGFEKLGAVISIEHGFVQMQCKKLTANTIRLDFPSVGATENLMMAASLAQGTSVIENVAQEPEIEDLGNFLNQAGAQIQGLGTSRLEITGQDSLSGIPSYSVISDRIEAGTLLIAGAITKGDVTVNNISAHHLEALLILLERAGCDVERGDNYIRVQGKKIIKAVDFSTEPFPGFPTDMQAQMMTLLTVSEGKSIIKETIFENRFMHVRELMRMCANIVIDDHIAIIHGVPSLSGAEVKITDLRAGAALILAGLVAEGETTVYGLKHLKRGYYNLPQKLRDLGAFIME